VVRGGSWSERPRESRASSRLDYPSWQRVYNVGFRVLVED
jgi:formylglycine-generating enzyme required for sulfatase activity